MSKKKSGCFFRGCFFIILFFFIFLYFSKIVYKSSEIERKKSGKIHHTEKLMTKYPYSIWRTSDDIWSGVFLVKQQKIKAFDIIRGYGVGKTKEYYFFIDPNDNKIFYQKIVNRKSFVDLLKRHGIHNNKLSNLRSFAYINPMMYKNHYLERSFTMFRLYKFPIFSKSPHKVFLCNYLHPVHGNIKAFFMSGNLIYGESRKKSRKEYFVVNVKNGSKLIFRNKKLFLAYLTKRKKPLTLLRDSSIKYWKFFLGWIREGKIGNINRKKRAGVGISSARWGARRYTYWELKCGSVPLAKSITLLTKNHPYYYGYSKYGWFILNTKKETYFLHWDKSVFVKRLAKLGLDAKLNKVYLGKYYDQWVDIPGVYREEYEKDPYGW